MGTKGEEEFYQEIDELQLKPRFGCGRLVAMFVLLFLILGSGLGYLIFSLRNSGSAIVIEPIVQSRTISQDGAAGFLIITESEINEVLDANSGRLNIDYLHALVDTEGVLMKGMLTNVKSRIEFVVVPTVVDDALHFKVKSVKIGSIGAPSWFGGQISSILNKEFAKRVKNSAPIDKIELEASRIIITFKTI